MKLKKRFQDDHICMLISKTFFRTKRCHKENDTCIDQNVYIYVIFFSSDK